MQPSLKAHQFSFTFASSIDTSRSQIESRNFKKVSYNNFQATDLKTLWVGHFKPVGKVILKSISEQTWIVITKRFFPYDLCCYNLFQKSFATIGHFVTKINT